MAADPMTQDAEFPSEALDAMTHALTCWPHDVPDGADAREDARLLLGVLDAEGWTLSRKVAT